MKNIVIFTSETCGYCHQAKNYLDAKGVSYIEKNISFDQEARNELIEKGFMGVPVIYVDDEVVHGFDKRKLDELLN